MSVGYSQSITYKLGLGSGYLGLVEGHDITGIHNRLKIAHKHYQFQSLQTNNSTDHDITTDGSRHSSAALDVLSVTHIMPTQVLNTCMDANMQFTINSLGNFSQTFP